MPGQERKDEEAPLIDEADQMAKRNGENHSYLSGMISDMILGAADGLTVPFALAAGLSGAFADSRFVVIAVLSELAAGAISMGLGGFLSAKSDVAHYHAERKREFHEVKHMPKDEIEETYQIFREFGLTDDQIAPICERFKTRPKEWVDFMMKFELGLDKPDESQPFMTALTIGGSYLVAGFIPLLPYLFIKNAIVALKFSIFFTILALFTFGFTRSHILNQGKDFQTAFETTITGALAAGAAFLIAKLVPT
mmetsp:Transcript_6102/g.18439  ORF Transcript_6102/g.18439 Transcript_6102/m.18439 type:complete len:252 (+) Transcript_6102:47-802(+)|eukprot:CAMPEP_0198736880 /NCGR_PEP_ID=MMETSP1475-20131203/67584_1 /TAXON_ID= ORGANISM="Unidentified sp., Strain CCMP1999" /NCGR_SAMPLE_ID=MMETSP1475 /ASSEMBLY_ACC=CAM_ASM_001111 /LENGTH=251 /DNA_ID=CAMNT_0044500733 /DNA_START=47 /DNA_END=802 /DNA_ORIENTATION=+